MAKRVRLTSVDPVSVAVNPESVPVGKTPRAPIHGAAREETRSPPHVADHAPARRTRRRQSAINEDIFYIPIDEIPEGSSYEWKRWSVHGEENPFYIAQLREQGWEPVNPKRHPNWLPPGYSQPNIIKGGQILMERPMALTLEAKKELRQLANQQMREAEQRLGMAPKGTGTRDIPDVAPRIHKEIGRMVPSQVIEE